MDDERKLLDKLQRIEALLARPGSDGERAAAASAAARLRARLAEATKDIEVEMRFSVADEWSRRVLLALLRRYGLRPYRHSGQRRTTILARMPRRLAEDTFWPQYLALSATLQRSLDEATNRVIDGMDVADTRGEELRTGSGTSRGR